MNMSLKACVPVKPYLLKFVQHIDNIKEDEPLNLNNGGVVGNVLKGYLTTKMKLQRRETKKSYASLEKEYTAILWYEVYDDLKQFNSFYISKKSIVAFNTFLHRLFHEMLLFKIMEGLEEGINAKDTTIRFMEKFGIEDTVDVDSLKKANYRLRLSKKIDIFQ